MGKKHILLYTDSRGKDIVKDASFDFYSEKLAKRYAVKAYLCPHKWTTTMDFLELTKDWQLDKFDHVILHLGVVDFAARPKSSLLSQIYPKKKQMFNEIFGEAVIQQHLQQDLGVMYEGEVTHNMYSLEMCEQYLLPLLKKIDNLIYISGNPAFTGWRGNYFRDRPDNIAQNDTYFYLFEKHLTPHISMMHWTTEMVKEYTYDIIHVNKKGSDYIFEQIEKMLTQTSQHNEKSTPT